MKKPYEVLASCHRQREGIRQKIEELQARDELWESMERFIQSVACTECHGVGAVVQPGCEINGPMMRECSLCKGTGERHGHKVDHKGD